MNVYASARIVMVGIAGLVGPVLGAAALFEPYMVTVDQAQVYDGERVAPLRLYRGDVLTACTHDLHRDWLALTIGGSTYQARADNFSRLLDLRIGYARGAATLRSRIEELTDTIAANDLSLEQLYAAEWAILFDAAVQYRYRDIVPLHTVIPAPGTGIHPRAPQPVRVVYRYADKISPSRARSQARRWKRERDELEATTANLRRKRKDKALELAATGARIDYVEWRFNAYRVGSGVLAVEPYVCTRDRTPLFQGEELATELSAGVVLLAGLNRANNQWLRMIFRGAILGGKRKYFLNRLGVESVLGGKASTLAYAIVDTEEQSRVLLSRQDMLEGIALAADYGSRAQYVQIGAQPFAPDYSGSRHYRLGACPLDAQEMVNRSRARHLIRDCEEELEDIDDSLQQNRRKLRSMRRELAAIEPRLEDLRQRLETARQEFPSAP